MTPKSQHLAICSRLSFHLSRLCRACLLQDIAVRSSASPSSSNPLQLLFKYRHIPTDTISTPTPRHPQLQMHRTALMLQRAPTFELQTLHYVLTQCAHPLPARLVYLHTLLLLPLSPPFSSSLLLLCWTCPPSSFLPCHPTPPECCSCSCP